MAEYPASEIRAELRNAANGVVAELLLALLTFVSKLGCESRSPRTPDTVRRVICRWRLLQHFADLRQSPRHSKRSNLQIIKLVNRQAARIAPGLRCSVRSLQCWIQSWNTVTDDGLAAGPAALIDRSGRPPNGSSNAG